VNHTVIMLYSGPREVDSRQERSGSGRSCTSTSRKTGKLVALNSLIWSHGSHLSTVWYQYWEEISGQRFLMKGLIGSLYLLLKPKSKTLV